MSIHKDSRKLSSRGPRLQRMVGKALLRGHVTPVTAGCGRTGYHDCIRQLSIVANCRYFVTLSPN